MVEKRANIGEAVGEGRSGTIARRRAHSSSPAGSPRNPLVAAVAAALRSLIEDEDIDVPSARRVELRNAYAALNRAYGVPSLANAIDLAWEEETDETIG